MSDTPQTLFVKDETGKVHGPLTFSAVGQLVASGILKGRVQMSVDGFQYADPGKFPNLRDLFPRSMWGQTAAVTDAPVRPAIPRPPAVGTHVTNASSPPRPAVPARRLWSGYCAESRMTDAHNHFAEAGVMGPTPPPCRLYPAPLIRIPLRV